MLLPSNPAKTRQGLDQNHDPAPGIRHPVCHSRSCRDGRAAARPSIPSRRSARAGRNLHRAVDSGGNVHRQFRESLHAVRRAAGCPPPEQFHAARGCGLRRPGKLQRARGSRTGIASQHFGLPAQQPLLRGGSFRDDCHGAVRRDRAGMGKSAGDLRLGALESSISDINMPAPRRPRSTCMPSALESAGIFTTSPSPSAGP